MISMMSTFPKRNVISVFLMCSFVPFQIGRGFVVIHLTLIYEPSIWWGFFCSHLLPKSISPMENSAISIPFRCLFHLFFVHPYPQCGLQFSHEKRRFKLPSSCADVVRCSLFSILKWIHFRKSYFKLPHTIIVPNTLEKRHRPNWIIRKNLQNWLWILLRMKFRYFNTFPLSHAWAAKYFLAESARWRKTWWISILHKIAASQINTKILAMYSRYENDHANYANCKRENG